MGGIARWQWIPISRGQWGGIVSIHFHHDILYDSTCDGLNVQSTSVRIVVVYHGSYEKFSCPSRRMRGNPDNDIDVNINKLGDGNAVWWQMWGTLADTHYIMGAIASQISSVSIVYSSVSSDGDQRKHQSTGKLDCFIVPTCAAWGSAAKRGLLKQSTGNRWIPLAKGQ